MCGIAGFFNSHADYLNEPGPFYDRLSSMARALRRRGPDDQGTWLSKTSGLAQARLAVIDLEGGQQPFVLTRGSHTWAISYNGELYNAPELKKELGGLGYTFRTASDTEVVLACYLEYGPDFARRLNGVFAFAIADPAENRLLLYRDPAGVKPLFYALKDGELFFSSELKGLFAAGIQPRLTREGLNEIFSLGPARTPGAGIFKGVSEILPGCCLTASPDGLQQAPYWSLESRPHTDSFEETVEKTAFLIRDAVRRQMVSDVPLCTFLSGGVDSSLVSAVCAGELKKQGQVLSTFSFDFTDNDKFFKANAFQPSLDRPYVEQMAAFLGTDHHYLECDSKAQADRLCDSVLAHDLPAMGDIDSSMLQFCSMVSPTHKVALTGECADEIFGGYPWFHKAECFNAHTFPWTMDLAPRKALLKDSFIQYLDMDAYVRRAYEEAVAQTPKFEDDTPQQARRREISWLNLRWFMQTLLNRMDRDSMYSGLEARVPFADLRIIEYLWNVPWEMKAKDGLVKGLLRQAGRGLVPEEILFRKKSPYPKTYDRGYERLLAERIREMAADPASPVMELLDLKKLERFLESPSDYGKPWYGQLMAGPQMLAYILQVNFWLEHYRIELP